MKLVKEDDKLFHFKGKDGEFKIVKKGLSKPAMDKIQKIKQAQGLCGGGGVQKMAKGGQVQHYFDGTGDAEPVDDMPLDTQYEAPLGIDDPADQGTAPKEEPQAPPMIANVPPYLAKNVPGQVEQPLVDPAATDLSKDPSGGWQASAGTTPEAPDQKQAEQPQEQPQQQPNTLAGLVQKQADLYNQQGKKQSAAMVAQADLQDKFVQDQQKFIDDSAVNHKRLQDENEELFKAARDWKLDPHKYVANMSVGNKIATAIGLILGGAGAGAHGTNVAMQVLDDNINKDIEAQKQDLGNKQNLLTQNLHKEGNLYAAENATRSQLLSMFAGKAQALATRSGSQQAMLQSQILGNALRMQAAPAIAAVNQQQMIQKLMGSNAAPELKIKYGVPAAQQEKAFGALDQARYAKQNSSNLMAAWQTANQDNTLGKRALHFGSEPASIATIQNLALPLIKDKEGRINEFEFETFNKLLPRPGDGTDKIKEKNLGMQQWIKQKGNSQLGAYGINADSDAIPTGAPVLRNK